MMQGLQFQNGNVAERVQALGLGRGLIIERCGPGNKVVKLLPPLTITDAALERGLKIVAEAVEEACDVRESLGALVS